MTQMRGVYHSRALGWLLILGILALWELSVRLEWIVSPSVPLFSEVVRQWWELLIGGEIPLQFLATFQRMFYGYLAAVVLGVALGILMGYFRFFNNLLEPITEFLRPMPSPAYIPIVILFLGIDDAMKIFVIFFACVWPIVLNTYSGVSSVQPVQLDTARTFGLGDWQTLRKVVIPASTPMVFTGLRISLALALILSIIAEMIASNDGIGHFILFAQRSFRVEDMFAGVISLGIVGYLLNRAFVAFEYKIIRWHYGSVASQ